MEIWGDFHGIVKDRVSNVRIGGALIHSNFNNGETISFDIPSDPINNGKYTLAHPPGSGITITCSATNYVPYTTPPLTLTDGQKLRLDFKLKHI